MELHLILLFMIFAALAAVQNESLISSVISLSAAGLGLSLAFLVLKAPNLAITQLVVEILCMVVLIRGTVRRDLPLARDGRWWFNTVCAFLFLAVFLCCAWFALKGLPAFGQPLIRVSAEYLARGQQETGMLNIVSGIMLFFRRADTLAEAAMVFIALIAALAITRRHGESYGADEAER
jgi:multisubunit Na+/H+ antiporter MnhB subunit